MRTRSGQAAHFRGALPVVLQSTLLAGGAFCNAETRSSVAVVARNVTIAVSNGKAVEILGGSSWQ